MTSKYDPLMRGRGPMFLFEGPDCAGKTAVANEVIARLKRDFPREPVTFMRQPSKDNIVRKLMVDHAFFAKSFPEAPSAAFHLIHSELAQASKVDVLFRAMIAMQKGTTIIMDRCFPSTMVYNGDWEYPLYAYMTPGCLAERSGRLYEDISRRLSFYVHISGPDVLFFLDINEETYFLRIANEAKQAELNDYDSTDMREVRDRINRYRKTAELLQQQRGLNVVTIDANQTLQEVCDQVYDIVVPFFNQDTSNEVSHNDRTGSEEKESGQAKGCINTIAHHILPTLRRKGVCYKADSIM